MDLVKIIMVLFGGLGIFILGMQLTSDGLQNYAAHKMKKVLGTLTENRVMGVLFGLLVTVALQSSSVTTVLLVGFVSASLMSLGQALGVVLGSAVGTTLTVQLIAFKITDYALFFIAAGVGMGLLSKKPRIKNLGQAVLGFGFIFYGMMLMSSAMNPLRNYPGFVDGLVFLSRYPVLVVVVTALFTAVIQGSAASIALGITLVQQGLVSLEMGVMMMYGANIGTTATALLASIASSREAKRVALAHLVFKLGGVLLFLPFSAKFIGLIQLTSGIPSHQIANAHSIFNIINMLIFLPFTDHLARLMCRLIPDAVDEERVAKYLDERVLGVPDLALSGAKSEILRMAKIIHGEMLPLSIRYLEEQREEVLEKLKNKERTLDFLFKATTRYLSQAAQRNLTEEQSEAAIALIYVSNDLEHQGDVIINMTQVCVKMQQEGMELAKIGWQEILSLYKKVSDNLELALKAFEADDLELAKKVIKNQPEIQKIEKNLRYYHCRRIQGPEVPAIDSGIHLDILNDLLRINNHTVSIAQAVMGII
ncbi:MAG: Na/Pi cotransporter family protein [Bacillota bacterium]